MTLAPLSDPPAWLTDPAKLATYARARQFAEVFRSLGLAAYNGIYWDGAHEHDDPLYWYFYPRDNGGVGACVQYDHGTYGWKPLDPDDLDMALNRALALGPSPTRQQVWAALDGD